MRRTLILTLLVMLCLATLQAKHNVVCYNQSNGLPHTHVTKIIQDDQGFIWIGTWNGLVRYDGYHFISFKSHPGDGNAILSDRVRDVLPDREIFKDRKRVKGNLFVVLEEDIFLFDIHTYKFSKTDRATEDAVRRLRARRGTKGFKGFQEGSRGFKGFQKGSKGFKGGQEGTYDRQGILWIRTNDGIAKVTEHTTPWQRIDGISANTVRTMYVDKAKRIWIATKADNHVAVFTPTMQRAGYLGTDGRLHREPTPFASIYSMLQDSDGTIWLGSKPDGLFRIRDFNGRSATVDHISLGKEKETNYIYDIRQDRKGRLWIATLGGGLHMISNPQAPVGQMKILSPWNTLKGQPASTMKVRKADILDNGTMILSTTYGLVTVSDIYAFPAKPLTWHHHLREANRTESLSSSATMSTLITTGGQMIVATETGGINIMQNIRDINNEKLRFRNFTIRNGLANDAVQAVTQLSHDEILVQQTNALSIINIATGECRNYTTGFWGEALRFSDAAPLLVNNGQLLLSLETGAISIPMKMLTSPKPQPQIALTMIHCAGEEADYSVNLRDTIVLKPHQRDLTLSFVALDYNASHDIMYQTRMDGIKEWSAPSDNTDITFNDLSAGCHQLEIRSTNAYGQWTDNTRTVTIIVEPMFFEAWYGILTLLLLISAVIAGITYTILYIRNMEARRRETLEAYLKLLEETQSTAHPGTEGVSIIAPRLSDDDEKFLRKLTEFVEQNISDSDITVNDMAQATATSRSSLNRRMHQLVGVTPADFLKEARLKRAAQLLRQTGKTVSEISYNCGFSDPKYFGKCFKASYGMSPKDYRMQ